MATSKSATAVMRLALEVASAALPTYSHPKSPHKFTQPQLFCCLVLKEYFCGDYRGVASILATFSDIRTAIGLKSVPHFSTIALAAKRLLSSVHVQKLLDDVVKRAENVGLIQETVALAAIDGSGFETRHASPYYVKKQQHRSRKPQRLSCAHYPTLGIIADCRSHLILAAKAGVGPWPEAETFIPLLRQARRRVKIHTLLGDKAYDSEANHRAARETFGVKRTLIPVRRPSPLKKGGPIPTTRYRREMYKRFRKKVYCQRWQVETVYSMLKRRLGSTLSGRSDRMRSRQLMLRAIVLDILIV